MRWSLRVGCAGRHVPMFKRSAVNTAVGAPGERRGMSTPVRAVLVVALLYLFLTGVELLGGGFKNLGNDLVDGLFEGVSNPIGGLCVGLLATVLVQSSSVSTSVIVGP